MPSRNRIGDRRSRNVLRVGRFRRWAMAPVRWTHRPPCPLSVPPVTGARWRSSCHPLPQAHCTILGPSPGATGCEDSSGTPLCAVPWMPPRCRGGIEEKGVIPEVKTASSVGRGYRARIPHRVLPAEGAARRHFRWAFSSFSISLSSPKRGLTDSPRGRRRRKIGERTGAEIGFPEGITPNSSNILLHRRLPRSPGIRSADERPGQVQGGENS